MLQVAWHSARKLRASRRTAPASHVAAVEPHQAPLGAAPSTLQPGSAARGGHEHSAAVRIQAHARGWLVRQGAEVRLLRQRRRLAARRACSRDWQQWQQAACAIGWQEAQLCGVRCLAAAEAAVGHLETRMQARFSVG